MPSHEPLSRSGITSRTGIPNDVMTFWVRRGLVRPIEAPNGVGRHLRFEWYEANIAGIMAQVRKFGVSIDGMLSIAATFREAIDWMAAQGLSYDDAMALWNYFNIRASAAGSAEAAEYAEQTLALFRHERHGPSSRVTERIEALALQVDEAGFRQHLDAYLTIAEQPEPNAIRAAAMPDVTYFWLAGDVWRFGRGEGAPEVARADGALATIAVDVSTVIYDVWTRVEAGA